MKEKSFPSLAIREIAGIKIDVRSPQVIYIHIGEFIYYIDDSTGENIMECWHQSESE